jgi:hypothetical protein
MVALRTFPSEVDDMKRIKMCAPLGVILLTVLVATCGSEWHMPGENITMPSSVGVGETLHASDAATSPPAPTGVPETPPAGARNRGTEVWFVPVPAGDMMRLAKEPELWPRAQKRVDVFSFYWLHGYDHPGFECGEPCGPNTYRSFLDVVPGGFYKWVADRFIVALEAGSVKHYACTEEDVRKSAKPVLRSIDNIIESGGRVDLLSLDEPFASGTNDPSTPGFGGCGLTPGEVAMLQMVFNEEIHARYPMIRIGLIEPYPKFSVDQLLSYLLELEHVGITIPFFHLDLHLQAAVGEQSDVVSDVRRIHEFCRARNIPFGVIVFGSDGRTNDGYAADAWATARMMASSTGVTEHTVFQSWAEPVPGNLGGLKTVPDTVPETEPFTHTGLIIRILEFLQIPAAP